MATTNTNLNKANQAQLINTGTDPNAVALGGTNATGTTTSGTTTTPSAQTYMDAYNQLAQQLTAANNASIDALTQANKINKQQTDEAYASNARQAYINYAKNQNALKEQLAAQGINGGASESAAVNMYNNYAQNVGNNNTQRNADLTSLQIAYDQNVANLNNSLAQTLANAQYEAMQNDLARQDTLNAQALEQYATTIERYTTVDSVNKAIANLNPNDVNYQAKLQLLQLRRAQIKAATKKTGSGTSTGGSTSAVVKSGGNNNGKSGGIVLVTQGSGNNNNNNNNNNKGNNNNSNNKKGSFWKWLVTDTR